MIKKIKILLADDQALFREGLHTLLSVQTGFEVIGEASNGEEALRLVAQNRPDVVLMDMRMPVMNGAVATRRLKESFPDCRVIALTTFDDDEYVFEALRAGAVGYLLKDVSSEKLFEAIRTAARGDYFLQPSITAKVVSEFARLAPNKKGNASPLEDPLSTRELEVLKLVATGANNKEIAATLIIAEGTVKNHLTSILSKLQARDRMQAAIKAKERGII
ncbi:MAG: response regulator transcription factor [Anaerolineaceae bacterium]|nr:response regulator transcription factor [Anaerolineaceae bacterium]